MLLNHFSLSQFLLKFWVVYLSLSFLHCLTTHLIISIHSMTLSFFIYISLSTNSLVPLYNYFKNSSFPFLSLAIIWSRSASAMCTWSWISTVCTLLSLSPSDDPPWSVPGTHPKCSYFRNHIEKIQWSLVEIQENWLPLYRTLLNVISFQFDMSKIRHC